MFFNSSLVIERRSLIIPCDIFVTVVFRFLNMENIVIPEAIRIMITRFPKRIS
jgi:hypothetical protein